MLIHCYPEFVPISFEFQRLIQDQLCKTQDGVSEYTFANLYLFRKRYGYQVCLSRDGDLLISGERDGHRFFMTPCALPDHETLASLFTDHDYWKNIPDSVLAGSEERVGEWGIELSEDRDNFDYLYLRTELAELSGKKFHKKRNLVNAFLNAYNYEVKPLDAGLAPDALKVLERWHRDKGDEGDYVASREVLEHFDEFGMQGAMYYINGRPTGWCLGESLAGGSMFAIHFEKGIDEYKGIYQFINQAFAASLPETCVHINREQDLGNEGLRQAKMTYRPVGFVRKRIGRLKGL
ncbi:MAG: DUF2156 domain-containing protein [Treponema sp.]|jgi:hypothetical protein|nr:DUF2156 domain-containing protein [Treponema sp.]